MNISSTKLHLTRLPQKTPCPTGDCPQDARAECRAELRDMVTVADNKLVIGTVSKAGAVIAGTLGFGAFTSGGALGMAGAAVGGAAAIGLAVYGFQQEKSAKEEFRAAFQKADETGCYTREELYQWYEENFG